MKNGSRSLQAIDLFAGAGGMSIGATQCGIDVKYAVEIDPYAAMTFSFNHPKCQLIQKSVESITPNSFPNLKKKITINCFWRSPLSRVFNIEPTKSV